MQNIHFFFFFFCISTLYTRRHWLEKKRKKERLVQIQCTTTSRGNGPGILRCYIHFVQPTPEIWMPSGFTKANLFFFSIQSSTVLDLKNHTPLWKKNIRTNWKLTRIVVKYMRDAWHACMSVSWHRGGHLVNIHIPVMTVHVQIVGDAPIYQCGTIFALSGAIDLLGNTMTLVDGSCGFEPVYFKHPLPLKCKDYVCYPGR